MKRPIASLAMPDVVPAQPDTPPPVFMTVRPEELLVDSAYQRDLSEASIRLIRRIVAEWDWRKFKAPVVAMTDEGPVVLDGQHTATAAASHPMIDDIPVLLVEAREQVAQAKAFVGMNTTRLGMTAAQLHVANVAAGDEAALAVDRVCARAGVKVLRLPPARGVYKAGDTIAVAAVSGLIARQREDMAVQVLSRLAVAGCAPLQAAQIRAVEHLVTDAEFGDLDPDDLGRIIATFGIAAADKEARAFAATHGVPLWKGLAAVWFKARRARKAPSRAPEAPSSEPDAPTAPPAPASPPDRGLPPPPPPMSRSPASAAHVAAARAAVPAPNFSGKRR